ncbi:MAG: hypothetical protein HND53_14765 [Proteobacteria bacterium]|nr:hypothetical protein [Pseudomonadota bacterium]NOG61751.1 hypothetical protein [Pseudomonadota bacterium]
MIKNYLVLLVLLSSIYSSVSATSVLSGSKIITLTGKGGKLIEIGTIHFHNENKKVTYELEFKEDEFNDEFLSMRPFKCIHISGQMICHLSYPYKKQGYISEHDFVDLEYDLLFLHKAVDEYGIDPWNGMYYDLTLSEDGFEGTLKEVDLNVLAAPPEDGVLRPITSDMLHDADPDQHLFSGLIIK